MSMSPKTGRSNKRKDIRGQSRCEETVQARELPAPWPRGWGDCGSCCSPPPRPWPCTFWKLQDGLAKDGDADTEGGEGGTFQMHPVSRG